LEKPIALFMRVGKAIGFLDQLQIELIEFLLSGLFLGYEAKPNWQGWDEVQAYLPQAEMQDLIVELRSLTLGVGSFWWQYGHLQEVRVLAKR
jgi:translation elongation factor EF-G